MSTQPISPNPNGNPFDAPFASEIKESQQRQAATPAKDTGYVNPFDEPLASEVAEAQHKAATAEVDPSTISTGPEGSNSDQQLMSDESQKEATKGGIIAPMAGAAVLGGLAAGGPVVAAIGEHLSTIKAIIDAAGKIGIGSLGYREARELYKEFAGNSKK